VRRIGQQLNAGALLEGSISGSQGQLRINAQLVSTKDGYHLWSNAYDVNDEEVFEAEDDIVHKTAAALRLPVEPGQLLRVANRETRNAEAHELYLQGRYYFSRRDLPDMERAVGLFQAAINKDPKFALAYTGLADTCAVMGGNDQEPLAEVVPKAQAALTRALELDPSMGEAYTTLALVNSEASGKRRALEADLRHAVQLSPNYATAHQWLGLILKGQGRFGEADAELRQAQLLDPLSPMITEGVAENYYYWRRYDDAIAQLDELQAIGFTASQELRGLAYI
jgi:serine/threonine-protein kinase